MALHCPECGSDNPLGAFYCTQCESALLPEAMIPPHMRRAATASEPTAPPALVDTPAPPFTSAAAPPRAPLSSASAVETMIMAGDGEKRYRIILGDTCPVCRAVSRISFTAERPPQIPIAGCQDGDGCRCSLPIFASALEAALASPDATLSALAPERKLPPPRSSPVEPPAATSAVAAPPAAAPPPAPPLRPAARSSAPARTPEWSQAAPITQQRRRVLRELSDLYYQRRIQGIRILTASDCCRVCAEVASSIYEPTIAPTLPVVGCWHGWECQCMYGEEALPLDARGMEAMERLAGTERERELRRRKIAKGGPRWLHQAVILVALVIAAGALLLRFGGAQRSVWEIVIPLTLAALSVGVALRAMARSRTLPSPDWTYALAGLFVAVVALHPLAGVRLPEGAWYIHPERLDQITASPDLTPSVLLTLALGQQVLAVAGLALLALGLLDATIRPDEKAGKR